MELEQNMLIVFLVIFKNWPKKHTGQEAHGDEVVFYLPTFKQAGVCIVSILV